MHFRKIFGVPCPTNMSAPPPRGKWKRSRASSWGFFGSFEERTHLSVERMLFVRMFLDTSVKEFSILTCSLDTRVGRHTALPPALIPPRRPGPALHSPFRLFLPTRSGLSLRRKTQSKTQYSVQSCGFPSFPFTYVSLWHCFTPRKRANWTDGRWKGGSRPVPNPHSL